MVSFVTIGCGEPKKGMGWYHLTQLLDEPRAQVRAVVEPWYLGPGKDAPGSQAFQDFSAEVKSRNPNVEFLASVEDLPDFKSTSSSAPVVAVIAPRTCQAMELFSAACKKGVTHVYLEKPGGESAEQISKMKELADSCGVAVMIGYNKNVSDYVLQALAELDRLPLDVPIAFEHNNSFVPGDQLVEFISGAGGEGMVHNMLCHELAIAVTYFGLTCERLSKLTLDTDKSNLIELPDGRSDWQRLVFRVSSEGGASREVIFDANRCGGSSDFSRVLIGAEGEDRKSFQLPSPEHEKWCESMRAQDSEIRGYFLLQSVDYKRLKCKLIDHIEGATPGVPQGVADLAAASEVLRLADFIAPLVKKLWKGSEPRKWVRQ